jgi:predicted AAA+ superfamily ATPase
MNQTTQENFIDNTDNNDNENIAFEERADFIKNEDLVKWTVESDFFLGIQKKILQKGAKLIVGPRGAGKTHQMKFAYEGCLHDKNKPLAIYVSFSKYYHLEPLLAKKTNAITLFHTWVLSKILLSTYQLLYELEKTDIVLYETESVNG